MALDSRPIDRGLTSLLLKDVIQRCDALALQQGVETHIAPITCSEIIPVDLAACTPRFARVVPSLLRWRPSRPGYLGRGISATFLRSQVSLCKIILQTMIRKAISCR